MANEFKIKNGAIISGSITGITEQASENSTKMASTAWVKLQSYLTTLPIATASILGAVKVGSGLSIDANGVLSVPGSAEGTLRSKQSFTATAGQTTFTISGGYTAGLLDVYLNGVLLTGEAITASNGTTIVLADAAEVGDIVDVVIYSPINGGFISGTTDSLVEGSTNLYFTNTRARAAISLTTTGTSGAATYNPSTGVLNIPQYQGGVTSFNTRTGAITLTSGDVTTALGFTPENAANKGVANGYASLDGSGLVPSSQLPSYVDDVLEYTNLAGFPATGTTGKIYVDLATNKIYRWSGSVYIEVSAQVGTTWGGITGTLSNQTDLQTALNGKQASLSGTGFVKISGTTISYDNSTYLTASTVLNAVLTPYAVGANTAVTSSDTIETAIEKLQGQINARLSANQSITLSGDASGSGTTSIAVTLANSGVTAGTYRSVTVDAKGRVTAGTTPTTISGYGITDFYSQVISGFVVGANSAVTSADTLEVAIEKLQGQVNARLSAESDTLATVTGRGATTSTALSLTARTLTLSNMYAQYQWAFGGALDLNWKTIANITLTTGLYVAVQFEVQILDTATNFGNSVATIPMKFYVSAVRSSGTQDAPDSGSVSGPVADYVRLVKTALGVYELQVRQTSNYRHINVQAQVTSQLGSTVTYATTPADGSTTGTIYTAAATHTDSFAKILALGSITGQSFVRTGGTSSQFLKADGSVDSSTYLTTTSSAVGLTAIDLRTISPSSHSTSRITAGFTSWANNNTSPFADYIHFRGYVDATGGNDNLLMFRKDALGIRVWQQTFGSTTAYATYKDIAWTDGTNATGSWGISVTGSAGSVAWTNVTGRPTAVSAFTNDSGYLTASTVLNTVLTPYAVGANSAVTASDTIETAIEKLQGQVNARISANQSITLSGDATGSGTTAITVTLANSGVTAGTYTKVTVDAKGRVTTGTTLSAGDIPSLSYLALSGGTLTGALTGTSATFSGTSSEPLRVERIIGGTVYGKFSLAISGTNVFSIYDAVAAADRLSITSTGQLRLNSYTSLTSFTGTAVGALGFDSSGNIITMAAGGGGGTTINGTGFVKASGTTISYDNSTYVPTNGTGATGTWGISISGNAATVSAITANTGLMTDRLTPSGFIDGLTTSNFRSTLFGTTTTAAAIATARWNTTPSVLTGLGSYSTMIAWGASDTQGFLAVDYNGANARIGGGNGNNINWTAVVLHSSNYTSYSPSLTGSGASGTWGINITGTAASETLATVAGRGAVTSTAVTFNGGITVSDGNVELYKAQTVDMSNTGVYSTSNYYPVTIPISTELMTITIQNNLNSNVPSWSTHPGGFTLNLKWVACGSGWGTTEIKRKVIQYHERFTNQTICGGITQMGNSSQEVVWLRGGGRYYFYFSRNVTATAQSTSYSSNSQTVSPTSSAQNGIWDSASGAENYYASSIIATSLTETSSSRYKENISVLTNPLERINKIRGVTYNRIGDVKKEVGVIAEEVASVLPEVIGTKGDGTIDSVSYGRLTAVLIEAVKEQQKQINELKELLNSK